MRSAMRVRGTSVQLPLRNISKATLFIVFASYGLKEAGYEIRPRGCNL